MKRWIQKVVYWKMLCVYVCVRCNIKWAIIAETNEWLRLLEITLVGIGI